MRYRTGRTAAIAVTAVTATMLLGAGAASANDLGVLRAVVTAAKTVSTPKVITAEKRIEAALKANDPHGVIAPLGVDIKANRRAVSLLSPAHGTTGSGRKLKALALAGFQDYLNGVLALRKSATLYIGGNRAASRQLIETYVRDTKASRASFKAAEKPERAVIRHLKGGGGGGTITPLPS